MKINSSYYFHRCVYYAPAFKAGETRSLDCTSPKVGRYVSVGLRVNEYLTLCEVEVFAVGGSK